MDRKTKTVVIINVLTIVLEIFALAIRPHRYGLPAIAFYTVLSNIITLVSSVWLLAGIIGRKNLPFAEELRFCSCCMLTVTFLVVVLILVWFTDPIELLFDKNNFYHHILIPVMTVYSYNFCESHVKDRKAVWLPMGLTIVYSIVIVILNINGRVDGPYPFFMTERLGLIPVILSCAGMGVIVYLLFCLLYKYSVRTEKTRENV